MTAHNLQRPELGLKRFECATVELYTGADGRRYPVGMRSVPMSIEAGTVLRNRYVIEECVGRGGKGTVFKALDRSRIALPPSQQYVAVKVLHQTPCSRMETLEALRHELQSAQALSHPNVVKVFDVDRHGDLDFFTMEFLEGELLSSLLARFQPGTMSREHAWPIIRQIAAGLQHAHERGIVHADLKPQNILITGSGEVRILDFGASHALAAPLEGNTGRSTSSVSLSYASCELLDGRIPDARDDLYALACIAYELLVGAHPFQRRRATEARDLGIVPVRPDGLSRRQWNTLAKGLSWHRGGRSVHLSDWVKGLKAGSTSRPASLREIQSFERPAPKDREISYLRASIAGTLLLITGVAWLLFFHPSPTRTLGSETPGTTSGAAPTTVTDASSALAPAPASPTATLQASPTRQSKHARFAEVRIHRPAKAGRDAPVVWWTEAASAKPGIDYVNQAKASFPAGRDSTSVFVKLLPRLPGDSPGVFYVAVAERGDPQHVAHTAVHLPGDTL